MTDVQVRGGTFPPGTECEFREDQFHFDEGSSASGGAKIYIGDAVEVRVIETRDETTTSPDAGTILCAAAIGAIAGFCFSGFSVGSGMVLGASIGGFIASVSKPTIPAQTTFEMRFSNDRSLVGTVDSSEWASIHDAWRVLASSTPSMLRPAKVSSAPEVPPPPAAAEVGADDNSIGVFQWLRRLNPCGGR